MALSKNEVIRIFMTSLKDEEWMGKREFYLSLLYIADSQINLNRDSSIPKAFARVLKNYIYIYIHRYIIYIYIVKEIFFCACNTFWRRKRAKETKNSG